MNATETNKIIAEFIGWEYKVLPVYSDDKFLGRKNIYNTPFKKHLKNKAFTTTFSENELVFHNDWNWLMEVVGKIESLGYRTLTENECFMITKSKLSSFDVRSKDDYSTIFSDNYEINHYGGSKKENVYNACVTFIEWYNKNAVKS